MRKPPNESSWSSRTAATLRSLRSWMHWRRRRELRRSQERELLLEQVSQLVHQQLVMALGPLSAALSRQDNLLLQQTQPLPELKEILLEALTELHRLQGNPLLPASTSQRSPLSSVR